MNFVTASISLGVLAFGSQVAWAKPKVTVHKPGMCLQTDISKLSKKCMTWTGLPAYSKRGKRIVILTEYTAVKMHSGAAEVRALRLDTIHARTGRVLSKRRVLGTGDHSTSMTRNYDKFEKRFARTLKKRVKKVNRTFRWRKWKTMQKVTKSHPFFSIKVVSDDDAKTATVSLIDKQTKAVRAVRKLKYKCAQHCELKATDVWVTPSRKIVLFRALGLSRNTGQHSISYKVARLK